MKRTFILTVIAMTLFTSGCKDNDNDNASETDRPLEIDNALTPEEIAAGILTPEVMWKMGRIGEFALSPDGTRLAYTRTDYNMAENRGLTTLWVQELDPKNAIPKSTPTESTTPKRAIQTPTETQTATRGDTAKQTTATAKQITGSEGNTSNIAWSADGGRIYFLSDRSGSSQVWEMAPDGSNARRLTGSNDGEGTPDIEGFGISPTGKHLWWVQTVRTLGAERSSSDIYPDLDKSQALIYDDLMVRHWDYWDKGEYRHIFVGELGDGLVTGGEDIIGTDAAWDAPLAPYFDMDEIAWNNAGTALAYTCKKLTGTEYALSTDSDIYLYDIASGTTENICKPAGREGTMPDAAIMAGYDKFPVFSPDDSRIAFRSMQRAGNESDKERLLIYDIATKVITELTADFDHSATEVAWTGDDSLAFIAPYFGTYQFCKVSAADGDVRVITSGDHDLYAFSRAGGRTVVSYTRQDRATELYTLDEANGELAPLTDINRDIFGAIKMGAIEKRMITTTDGQQMLTWVVFPPDFDPTKKYPALLYCEGGPQSCISQFWSYRWNFQLIAAQGYIVVAPNRRGTTSFGQQWTDEISGDYSGQNISDLLSAIDEMAREPYVDASRLGCVGASYGGYSAFYLAGTHQKRFKAFVAHCGIFDFESMYGSTEELFFVNNDYGGAYWSDSPTAKRSYANSPHKFVKNWDTPIMIVTGLNDFRIPYTQSLEAHTAARLMGVPSRLVAFEDEAHQVFRPQNSIVWNREFFGWLDKYVKNPK